MVCLNNIIISANKAAGSVSTTGASSYEVKQLEQQNNRLRETLVKMRDLSAHEKHEFQKLQKDMDQKKSEILELGRTKEKLSTRVEEMEHQIADLQEQVRIAYQFTIISWSHTYFNVSFVGRCSVRCRRNGRNVRREENGIRRKSD